MAMATTAENLRQEGTSQIVTSTGITEARRGGSSCVDKAATA
jgi:hypothetical protein